MAPQTSRGSYGVARMPPELTAAAVAIFLRTVVVPAVRQAGWSVERVLTDGAESSKRSSLRRAQRWGFATRASSRATQFYNFSDASRRMLASFSSACALLVLRPVLK